MKQAEQSLAKPGIFKHLLIPSRGLVDLRLAIFLVALLFAGVLLPVEFCPSSGG
jgi:Zn-dependent membrane protease YugP